MRFEGCTVQRAHLVARASPFSASAASRTTYSRAQRDWDATENGMADMDHGMGGMMALQDALGADAGALYLTQMIMHHEGAIVSSQTAEIAVMNDLLATE
nr:DUF305 domain-containing protein [Cryobacterium glaciale]